MTIATWAVWGHWTQPSLVGCKPRLGCVCFRLLGRPVGHLPALQHRPLVSLHVVDQRHQDGRAQQHLETQWEQKDESQDTLHVYSQFTLVRVCVQTTYRKFKVAWYHTPLSYSFYISTVQCHKKIFWKGWFKSCAICSYSITLESKHLITALPSASHSKSTNTYFSCGVIYPS